MVNQTDQKAYVRAARIFIPVLLFCALFAPPAQAAPENFILGRPGLSLVENTLSLAIPLSVDNEDALGELLRDGANIELTIEVEIQRKRSVWFDESIHKTAFKSLLRHDPLSRDYRMIMPGSEQILQDKNLRALLMRTWKAMRLPIAPAELFLPENDYLIKLNLSLKHTALPPWLDRTLVFWSKDVVNKTSLELEYRIDDAAVSR